MVHASAKVWCPQDLFSNGDSLTTYLLFCFQAGSHSVAPAVLNKTKKIGPGLNSQQIQLPLPQVLRLRACTSLQGLQSELKAGPDNLVKG